MRSLWIAVLFAGIVLPIVSCNSDDADYKSGIYWLNERGNWQSAVQAFERSMDKYPDRWKTHVAMLDALAHGDDTERLERQLSETFHKFPDSTRSPTIVSVAGALLGDDRVNQLGGHIELENLERLMGPKTDKADLLARAVIAGCRAQDQKAVSVYLGKLLDLTKGDVPDSVRTELGFFIGPAQLDRIQQSARLDAEPDNPDALLRYATAALYTWETAVARKSIARLSNVNREVLKDENLARQFSELWDVHPFQTRTLTTGWEGARSADLSTLIFIRDLGTATDPDMYILRNGGGSDQHMMKANQQGLRGIFLPRISPDGSWIYFYASHDRNWKPGDAGRFDLYRQKPVYGSIPVKLTDTDLLYTPPYFEKDGSVLLVRRDLGSVRASAEVIRLNPANKELTSIVRIANPVQSCTFTPSADSLLFVTSRGMFKRSLKGGTVTVERVGQKFAYPCYSPNGVWLAVQGPDNALVVFNRSEDMMYYLGQTSSPIVWIGSDNKLLATVRDSNGKDRIIETDLNRPASVSESIIAKTTN